MKSRASIRSRKFFAGEDGSYQLYEDDGETQSYLDGDFALTTFSQSNNGETIELKITRGRKTGYSCGIPKVP